MKYQTDKNCKPLKLLRVIKWAPSVFLVSALTYAIISEFREGWKSAEKPNLETKVEQTIDRKNDNLDFQTKFCNMKNQKSTLKREDYKTNDFSKDSDNVLLARMLFGEARGCSKNEKIEIAYTVINRINDGKKWNEETLREVILKPWQYSCFNKNDVNYKKVKDPLSDDVGEGYSEYNRKAFEECLEVVDGVLANKYPKLNKGQTHFFNPKAANPYWAFSDKMEKIGKIGNSEHVFYREK